MEIVQGFRNWISIPMAMGLVLPVWRQAHAFTGPCDIYLAAGNPCIAAHSTVRALYGAFSGALYQVRRSSDNTMMDIKVVSPGGQADGPSQDAFCKNTQCVITKVYDQSGKGNFVEYQGTGSSVGGVAKPAVATSESLTVSGHKVYSLYIQQGMSYWRNGSASGVPLGSAPEGIYMVTSGKHFNNTCCFDYGNSETNRLPDGAAAMDAINFSAIPSWEEGADSGPWIMADLEYGLFSHGGGSKVNANDPTQTSTYVTALLKNNGTTEFALKGGNAQSGSLGTYYKGALPPGYNPMKKQGAIVLGSGGDCCPTNFNLAAGTFYEGAIVTGYPSDSTDNAIQANISEAGYGSTTSIQPSRNRNVTASTGGLFLSLGSDLNIGFLPRDGRSMRLEARNLFGKRVAAGYLSAEGRPIWTSGSLPNGAYIMKAIP